jgi:putative glutamine amidotransferase
MTQRRPIIGITTQTLQSLGGVSPEFPASWVMSHRYINTVAAAGGLPWMIPLVEDATLRGIYETLDGVFLPGGADVDPGSYGALPHPACDKTDTARDHVELQLSRWAIEDRKPVFGVCRGHQVINLAMGGTLYQDIADQMPGSIKHDYFPFAEARYARDHLAHEVLITEEDSYVGRLAAAPRLMVNSMHHQAIRDLANGLVATAVAEDGVVEAVEGSAERGDQFLLGVQWHPEALTERDPRYLRLFEEFVEASGAWRDERSAAIASDR